MMTGHTYYKEMIIKICGIDKKKSTWRWQLKILVTDAQRHGHFIETEKKNPGKNALFIPFVCPHVCMSVCEYPCLSYMYVHLEASCK